MTPVKVVTNFKLWITFILIVECEVLPTLYKIVLFRELPATLILPFSFILKPLMPKNFKIKIK